MVKKPELVTVPRNLLANAYHLLVAYGHDGRGGWGWDGKRYCVGNHEEELEAQLLDDLYDFLYLRSDHEGLKKLGRSPVRDWWYPREPKTSSPPDTPWVQLKRFIKPAINPVLD